MLPGLPLLTTGSPATGTIQDDDPPQAQTITFGSLTKRTYGEADFAISATATSGLPVSFTSSDNAIASVSPGAGGVWFVHINAAGSVTITAHQDGNAGYESAPVVAQVAPVLCSLFVL